MARFDNRIILISGGARGQGAAEARLLVAEGAKVVIGDVLETEGRQLAAELGAAARSSGTTSPGRPTGPAPSPRPRRSAACTAWSTTPASISRRTLMETDAALFERHMRINQLGCFLGMKAVVPLMEQSGGGSIVNISSVAGLRGLAGRHRLQRDEMGAARHDQGGRRSISRRARSA